MKKSKAIIAITALAILATAVAVVSCKKDEQQDMSYSSSHLSATSNMRHIDDMGSYLKNFRKKMLESNGNETLSLEEAAWHLACMANIEHCNINVEFDDVRFDTVCMQVNVTDGGILMTDLRTVYEQMWPAIQRFQKGLNLDNQNLRFVNMSIFDDGNVEITMMTTSFSAERLDHLWYFQNSNYADSICNQYYEEGLLYQWNNAAISHLTTALNIIGGHYQNTPDLYCYIPTRSFVFNYNYWYDPYGSPFYNNSRLFTYYDGQTPKPNYYLDADEMCYCLDSYVGMGKSYIVQNPYVQDERPVSWLITPLTPMQNLICHSLTVQYGQFSNGYPGPNPN